MLSTRTRPIPILLATLAATGPLIGCADEFSTDAEDGVERFQGGLVGYTKGYWTSNPNAATPVNIGVCWENPTSTDATFRTTVQNIVSANWQRYTRLNFTGWAQCKSGTPEKGIHIFLTNKISGGAPGRVIVGSKNEFGKIHVDGVRADANNGMQLDPTNTSTTSIQHTALHEFGHALGFSHEESRAGYTGSQCGNGDSTFTTGSPLGAYDSASVMSYCSPGNSATSLSLNDVAAIQHVYGRRRPGTLVSRAGYCLKSGPYTASSTGTQTSLSSCDEKDQFWYLDQSGFYTFPSTATYSIGAYSACLDEHGTGANVTEEGCLLKPPAAMLWTLDNGALRAWGGLCLTLPGGSQTNGNELTMNTCVYDSTQKWNITSKGEIRLSANTNMCATVRNWGTDNGTKIALFDCVYPDAQKFAFAQDKITYSYNGVTKCFDTPGVWDSDYVAGNGLPTSGGGAQLWDCVSTQQNQRWNFDGRLKSGNGYCLDRGSTDAPGVSPVAQGCSTSSRQQWEYYFR
jgi:hypothetical protein